ncbi:MAG: amino acid adenylation domain-containing protein [bacterium]|nr:amino acid adenylation domain-containing protein [bacterium]
MIVNLFKKQVLRTPHHCALKTGTSRITYGELAGRVEAAVLEISARFPEPVMPHNPLKTGPPPGRLQTVALLFPQGPDMVVAVLSALDAGLVYVPLDPAYPEKRLRYMLEDSGARLLITDHGTMDLAARLTSDADIPIVDISTCKNMTKMPIVTGNSTDDDNLPDAPGQDRYAYLLYTSGSTGKPKAVLQTQANILHYANCYIKTNTLSANDRMTLFSSFSHDASVIDIFSALTTGATLYPLNPGETDIIQLPAWLQQEGITVWHSVPTFYRCFVDILTGEEKFPRLRLLVLGGEAVLVNDIRSFNDHFPEAVFINLYGQAESSYNSSLRITADASVDKVTLGETVDGVDLLVVDETGEEAAVFGTGEIVVLSDYIAHGYWQKNEPTNAAFRHIPGVGKIFRTGDFGRVDYDGSIEFLGRKDFQVKIRGHRIEPAEIEAAMLTYPGVKKAVVTSREKSDGDNYLCAYIVPGENLEIATLRTHLSIELPAHMIPSYFVESDNLPLTPSGKVDRMNLPESEGHMISGSEHQTAGDAIEQKLVDIWQDTLNLDSIGVNDNFFEIGGHSLKAGVLSARVHNELETYFPMREVFRLPTIKRMAGYIRNADKAGYLHIKPAPKAPYYPVSHAQKRIFAFGQLAGGTAYNMPGVALVEGTLDNARLDMAFRGLIQRHESLRTCFDFIDNQPVQVIRDNVACSIEYHEIPDHIPVEEIEQFHNTTISEFIRPFDFSVPPLLRMGIIRENSHKHLLLYDLHHIVSDGSSNVIIINDFFTLYYGDPLPPLPITYKDYALWLQESLQSGLIEKQENYWRDVFSGAVPLLEMPTDYPRGVLRDYSGDVVSFVCEGNLSYGLKTMAASNNVTLYMLLLSIFNVLLAGYSGQEDVVVGTASAGRKHTDLQYIVGMFANTIPIRSMPAGDKRFRLFLSEVRENVLASFENQDYPFEELVEKLQLHRDYSRNPLFDTMFVLQNLPVPQETLEDLNFHTYHYERHTTRFDLVLNCSEGEEQLFCDLEYSNRLFKRETMEQFASDFLEIAAQVTATPDLQLSEIYREISVGPAALRHQVRHTDGGAPHLEILHVGSRPDSDDSTVPIQLDAAEKKEFYPVSAAQKQAFILHQIEPDGIEDNIYLLLHMQGKLSTDTLETAARELARRHESVRTCFRTSESQLFQVISPAVKIEVHEAEIPAFYESSRGQEKTARNWQEPPDEENPSTGTAPHLQHHDFWIRTLARPFSLNHAPLFRLYHVLISETQHLVLMETHRIIADGRSMDILQKEFVTLCAGEIPDAPGFQYKDFMRWRYQREAAGELERQSEYWNRQFSGVIPVLELPVDTPCCGTREPRADYISFTIGKETARGLKALAGQYKTGITIVLLSLFNILLSKLSGPGGDDIVVGYPVLGRPLQHFRDCVGCFSNILPLRNFPSGAKSFPQFLNELRLNTINALDNREYRYETLITQLDLERDLGRSPLFNVMFAPGSMKLPAVSRPGLQAEGLRYQLSLRDDLAFLVDECREEIDILALYAAGLFKRDTIHRFITYYQTILSSILDDPHKKLGTIDIITKEEKEWMLEKLNNFTVDYPRSKTLHGAFLDQVEKHPGGCALSGPSLWTGNSPATSVQLTYNMVNKEADRLARQLHARYPDGGRIVAFMMPHSLEMIICILGILKSGCAYLPLEPRDPPCRTLLILKDSAASLLLKVSPSTRPDDSGLSFDGDTVYIESLIGPSTAPYNTGEKGREDENGETNHFQQAVESTSPAYVMYLPGTVDRVTGFVPEHRNVIRLLMNDDFLFDFNHRDTWSMYYSICFDISVWEMFGALLAGSRLVVVPPGNISNPRQFLETLQKEAVTILNQIPSDFYRLSREVFKQPGDGLATRIIVFRSESLKPFRLEEWHKKYPRTRFFNMYGTAETTTYITTKEIVPDELGTGAVSIGRPLATTCCLILDRWLKRVPVGVVGELYIAGESVCRGYLNRPELTARNFLDPRVVCPTDSVACPPHDTSMSRTGDLVRLLPNGEMEYMGGVGHQVKIKGYRIGLGEIENRLLRHMDVKNAVAAIWDADDYFDSDGYICAYIVPVNRAEDKKRLISELEEYLIGKLPAYMLPTRFVILEQIPMTRSGRVDRDALPAPEETKTRTYVPPRSVLDEALLELWARILRQPRESIGIEDDFFHMGGDSLKAIILTEDIRRELELNIPPGHIIRNPTIKGITSFPNSSTKCIYALLEPAEKKEYYPLTSIQNRLFFLYRKYPHSTAYNMPVVFLMKGRLIEARLKHTFDKLIRRHQSLRTYFVQVDGIPYQKIHPQPKVPIQLIPKISKSPGASAKDRPPFFPGKFQQPDPSGESFVPDSSISTSVTRFVSPFHLEQAPLIRLGLLKLEKETYVLVMDIHHIIADEISVDIFIHEFMALRSGEALPDVTINYTDYAQWTNKRISSDDIRQQETYWLKQLEGKRCPLQLPLDYPREKIVDFIGDSFDFQFGLRMTSQLKELALKTEAPIDIVILALFHILLSKLCGCDDTITGITVTGRRHGDLRHVIGMFAKTLVLRNYPGSEKSFDDFLGEVRTNTLQAFENRDYPLENLVKKVAGPREPGRNPLFDAMLIHLDNEALTFDIPGLTLENLNYKQPTAKFDLTLIFKETHDSLLFTFDYASTLFSVNTIKRFARYFETITQSVLQAPTLSLAKVEVIPTPEYRQLLYEFNTTQTPYPRKKTLYDLFRDQVEKSPGCTALIYRRSHLTYRQLEQRADALAGLLMEMGADSFPVGIIAVLSSEPLQTAEAIAGILKSGCGYLPLNPSLPVDRINFMLADANVNVLVTRRADAKHIAFNGSTLYLEDTDAKIRQNGYKTSRIAHGDSRGIAYLIYTSGSTGRPKGVPIEHRNIVNTLGCRKVIYNMNGNDTIMPLFFYSFDGFVTGFFTPLISGAQLLLTQKEKWSAPGYLLKCIRNHRVTHLLCLPTLFRNIALGKEKIPHLRVVTLAGEPLLPSLRHQTAARYPELEIINEYGVSEASVLSCLYRDQQNDSDVKIGKPIWNTKIYILDCRLGLQPLGVPGELCLSGAGVFRGYLNDPQGTAEKFIPNPFVNGSTSEEHGILYRTGDLARRLSDGNLQFLGRIDRQVKIKGYRVEPEEIENRLAEHEALDHAVVVTAEAGGGDKFLCAFVVPSKSAGGVTPGQLKRRLAAQLPHYMVPAYIDIMEKPPLTASGKVDRNALPKPGASACVDNLPPTNGIQMELARIQRKLLDLKTISVRDNFFYIGGDSLKALQLAAEIKKSFRVPLSIMDMFDNTDIHSLDHYIRRYYEVMEESEFLIFNGGKTQRVFCFPPSPGYGFPFEPLAEAFGNISFYAFNFIEDPDRVARYADFILRFQADGGCVLMGWSLGGRLAFEVGAELEKRGRKVSRLILLDTFSDAHSVEAVDLPHSVPGGPNQFMCAYLEERIRGKSERYRSYGTGVFRETLKTEPHILLPRCIDNAAPGSADTDQVARQGMPVGSHVHNAFGAAGTMLITPHLERNIEILKNILSEVFFLNI